MLSIPQSFRRNLAIAIGGLILCLSSLYIWLYTSSPLGYASQLFHFVAPVTDAAVVIIPSTPLVSETFVRAVVAYGAPDGIVIGAIEPGREYGRTGLTQEQSGVLWVQVYVLGSGAVWVRASDLETIPASMTVANVAAPLGVPTPSPTSLDKHALEVNFPPRIRLEDSDSIQLSIYPTSQKLVTNTMTISGNIGGSAAVYESIDIYADLGSFQVISATAYLRASKMDIEPSYPVTKKILNNEIVTWNWSLSPQDLGSRNPVIVLEIYSNEKDNPYNKYILKNVEIPLKLEVVTLFGLSLYQSRILSAILGFIGVSSIAGILDLFAKLRKLFGRRPVVKK